MTAPKIFLDSNILLYLMDKDVEKKLIIMSILSPTFMISTQVISENVNTCLRKFKLSKKEAFGYGKKLISILSVKNISTTTIEKAFIISEKYNYSYWDSLIIATALENGCDILYTEDLTDGQIIEKKLKVVNPFKNLG